MIQRIPTMTATPSQDEIALELDAHPEVLSLIRERFNTWCLMQGVDARLTDRICLAIDEAAANVIRHAYAGRPGPLRLRGTSSKIGAQHRLILTLEDDGKQVPLNTIRPRDLKQIRPGGLGVHLIQEVMDEACWTHREAGGTELKMTIDVSTAPVTQQKEIHNA
jgi:anti-sigma regulatory factor (Ser/Thr protein kinase)